MTWDQILLKKIPLLFAFFVSRVIFLWNKFVVVDIVRCPAADRGCRFPFIYFISFDLDDFLLIL